MKKINPVLGKVLYALIFNAVIPVLLWFWAKLTAPFIKFPPIESLPVGISILIIGVVLIIWGMLTIVRFGKGLPMNPYPPKKLVAEGPFRIVRHPIYWGFGIAVCGTSIAAGSASGLWLVTPVTIMSMVALVWGYEKIGLEQRFPGQKIRTFFDIGGEEMREVGLTDRLPALFIVVLILVGGNFITGFLVGGVAPLMGKAWDFHSIFENRNLCFVSLVFVIGVPFLLKREDLLREWTVRVLFGLGLSLFISLLWPSVGAQYLTTSDLAGSVPEKLTSLFGSIPLFLILLSHNAYDRQFKRYRILLTLFVALLIIVQLAHSRSSDLHLLVSLTIYVMAVNYSRIWIQLKNLAERLANSWKEWVFGPVRIINHASIIGFGAIFGIMFAGWLAGREYAWPILIFAVVLMVCSAVWAQLVEGSDKLKRPFGYYGAIVGIIFAGLILWLMGYNVWLMIGLAAVLMPWVQAIGRFRCLANGCCHGRPTDDDRLGIRYFHDRTRVCGLSGLKGKLIHPTPLYSIMWLFLMGFVMLALWQSRMPYSFIFGIYLILSGIGRFVEEAYRGEVQTPILDGLHLYQWTAIASGLIGVCFTMIPVKVVDLHPQFGWEIPVAAIILGLLSFFAMGVDFPKSNARFSRLV